MVKKIFLLIITICLGKSIFAQTDNKAIPKPTTKKTKPVISPTVAAPLITKADLKKLNLLQDSLYDLLQTTMYDTVNIENRKSAGYKFIPTLISALKTPNSYYFPFDSIPELSKVYPQDSTFRILTWQMHYPRGKFRYFGVIQYKSKEMKIIPLYDLRDTLAYHTQKTLTPQNWYGCIYYNIMEHIVNKKPVYTLFGYEVSSFFTRRKIIEILTFDDNGKPKFGAPMFHYKYSDTTTHTKMLDTLNRYFLEYKWDANIKLNYDPTLEMIVFDHVSAPDGIEHHGAEFLYVQDGTYEGFKWYKDRWQWVEKVFTFSINENDNPPIPVPLFGTPNKQPTLPDNINEKPAEKR